MLSSRGCRGLGVAEGEDKCKVVPYRVILQYRFLVRVFRVS